MHWNFSFNLRAFWKHFGEFKRLFSIDSQLAHLAVVCLDEQMALEGLDVAVEHRKCHNSGDHGNCGDHHGDERNSPHLTVFGRLFDFGLQIWVGHRCSDNITTLVGVFQIKSNTSYGASSEDWMDQCAIVPKARSFAVFHDENEPLKWNALFL